MTDFESLTDYESFGSSSTGQHEKYASQHISYLFTVLENKLIQRIPREIMEKRYAGIQSKKLGLAEDSHEEYKSTIKSCCC
jgi:hypothetical protein